MGEPKFTPGPWLRDGRTVYSLAPLRDRWGSVDEVNKWFTGVQFDHRVCTEEEALANAHLIAAAPDLYAALEGLLKHTSAVGHAQNLRPIKAALDALAKARGESDV